MLESIFQISSENRERYKEVRNTIANFLLPNLFNFLGPADHAITKLYYKACILLNKNGKISLSAVLLQIRTKVPTLFVHMATQFDVYFIPPCRFNRNKCRKSLLMVTKIFEVIILSKFYQF